jgi:hypothetical protein
MNNYDNFEDQLDEIRVQLFEETQGMKKAEIIEMVNSRGRKIAKEFGITVIKEVNEKNRPAAMINAV